MNQIPHNALLLELRRAEEKRASRIARWWHRKLHGQWTWPECVRGWVGMSLALWGGVAAVVWVLA